MPEVNKAIDSRLTSLIDRGAPVADAVRIALWAYLIEARLITDRHSRSAIASFAKHRGLDEKNFAASIYNGRTPTTEMLEALIDALGGTADEWRELLWRAAKPVEAAV